MIEALYPQAKIYLFGSFATNKQVRGSDIDIAIDAGAALERVKTGEMREILNATDIPYKIDLVDFHLVSEAMQKQILKEGLPWKI